jgi:hypothetical protein
MKGDLDVVRTPRKRSYTLARQSPPRFDATVRTSRVALHQQRRSTTTQRKILAPQALGKPAVRDFRLHDRPATAERYPTFCRPIRKKVAGRRIRYTAAIAIPMAKVLHSAICSAHACVVEPPVMEVKCVMAR